MLDWVPNTNHTGLFVAQDSGYFTDAGLRVEIIQPGEVYAEQAVASGAADFGVSFQEQVTLARADGIPIVSIAAILQHNTSAFASRADLEVVGPADWEGLRYGSFGSPFEAPTLAGTDGLRRRRRRLVWRSSRPDLPTRWPCSIRVRSTWHGSSIGWQGLQAEQLGDRPGPGDDGRSLRLHPRLPTPRF